jgi:hypothetical protein
MQVFRRRLSEGCSGVFPMSKSDRVSLIGYQSLDFGKGEEHGKFIF